MRVDGIPNVRVCELPIRPGMKVERQGPGPFYAGPLQAVLAMGDHLFPVGFYYKWFVKPPFLSRQFIRQLRPMTGIGILPDAQPAPALAARLPQGAPGQESLSSPSMGKFPKVIVGAGPSGLAAASNESEDCLLIDEHPMPGGQRWPALAELADDRESGLVRFPVLAASHDQLRSAIDGFKSGSSPRFLAGTRVVAGYHPGGLVVRQGDRLATVQCDELIWAAGALDTLGLFPGNDTPGVMGPRALMRLLTRDGLRVEQKAAMIIGGGLDFWLCAALLAVRGAHVMLVVTESGWQSEVSAAVDLRWQLNTGLKLDGVRARKSGLLEATLIPRRSAPGPVGSQMKMQADLMVICEKAKPTYDIPYQLGANLTLEPDLGGFVPDADATGDGIRLRTCGEAAGHLPFAQPGLDRQPEAR